MSPISYNLFSNVYEIAACFQLMAKDGGIYFEYTIGMTNLKAS